MASIRLLRFTGSSYDLAKEKTTGVVSAWRLGSLARSSDAVKSRRWWIALALLGGCGEETLFRSDVGPAPSDAGSTIRVDSGASTLDLGPRSDATPTDLGFVDAGTLDAGAVDAGAPDVPPPSCANHAILGTPERERVVLVGQSFTPNPGQVGTEIRSLTLTPDGTLTTQGIRLDVGADPARIEFVPSGELALVVANDPDPMQPDHLISVAVDGPLSMRVVDRVRLPNAGYGDLRLTADGRTAYTIGSNSTPEGGVSVVDIACDGTLTLEPQLFINVLLAASMVFRPGEDEVILLGGQAVFTDPPDPNDVRLLRRVGRLLTDVRPFDIYGDFIDALRIAVDPLGRTLLIPNGSPFSNEGNQLSIVAIDRSAHVLTEVDRLMNFDDAREAIFSPDGQTALVTQFQPGKVAVLTDLGAGLALADEVGGIGLAEQMAMISRGSLSGRVFVTSVDPSEATGPNIAMLRIASPGVVTELPQLNLGSGSENIPGAIAVTP
jgi:hypothetical protein